MGVRRRPGHRNRLGTGGRHEAGADRVAAGGPGRPLRRGGRRLRATAPRWPRRASRGPGSRVCVLERGREILPGDYPDTLAEAGDAAQVSTPKGHVGDPSSLFSFHVGDDISVLSGVRPRRHVADQRERVARGRPAGLRARLAPGAARRRRRTVSPTGSSGRGRCSAPTRCRTTQTPAKLDRARQGGGRARPRGDADADQRDVHRRAERGRRRAARVQRLRRLRVRAATWARRTRCS